MLNVHRKSHTAAHFQLRRSSCNSLGSTLSLLGSGSASASGSVRGDDILPVVVGWKPCFALLSLSTRRFQADASLPMRSIFERLVIMHNFGNIHMPTTRERSYPLCLPPPLPILSVLEPWPTWIWASVVRDLGTCSMSQELNYDCRHGEPQLTLHLPLPNVAPFSCRE